MKQTKINIDSLINDSMTPQERESLKRAYNIANGKDAVWANICRKADIQSPRTSLMRRIVRIAAVLIPVLAIAAGVRYALPAYQRNLDRKAVKAIEKVSEMESISIVADTLVFHDANLQMVVNELKTHYNQIKAVVGNASSDSVLVTTSFVHQPLDEVLEELNYHFNQKLSLDDNGNLTISD